MGAFRWFGEAIRVLGIISLGLAAVELCVIMIVGALDAVTTAAFSAPVPGAAEIASACLAASVFGSLPYAQRMHQNISVDIIESTFPKYIRSRLVQLNLAVGTAFFAILCWRAVINATESVAVGEYAAGAVSVPIFPFKAAVAFALAVTAAEFLRQLVDTFVSRFDATLNHSGIAGKV
jgi:TRAP-type C4-dicarboxylate transport system permease small subunit